VKTKASPWLFPEGTVFPVISGEFHPLKRVSRRLLVRGIVVAGILHLGSFGGWLVARNMKPEPPPPALTIAITRVTSPADLGVPSSLAPEVDAAAQMAVAAASTPSIGVPEPVPDFQATTTTLATTDQLAESLTPVDMDQLRSNSDSLVVDESVFEVQSDRPVDINQIEELPVVINAPDPVYPEMARSGEVEGEVRVRVLINKEGKVAEASVVDGNWILHDAAVAAAKKYTFKPALQQRKPVPVRVDIVIPFTLN
jgi:TonB family protein